jgi:hypothetical protein
VDEGHLDTAVTGGVKGEHGKLAGGRNELAGDAGAGINGFAGGWRTHGRAEYAACEAGAGDGGDRTGRNAHARHASDMKVESGPAVGDIGRARVDGDRRRGGRSADSAQRNRASDAVGRSRKHHHKQQCDTGPAGKQYTNNSFHESLQA